MIQESQLEHSLKGFALAVDRLFENPSLDSALDADIVTIRLMGEEELTSGEVSFENLTTYNKLVCLCLRKFREMIPNLNGQARHVDLYCEQMAGRMRWINKRYNSKNYRRDHELRDSF